MTASRPAELVELCREFLTEARLTLAQLRNTFTLKQSEELRNRAHYLKGSSMVMGAAERHPLLRQPGSDGENGKRK